MAVASTRVSSVQLTASSGATSAFYSGGQQQRVATRGRKGVATLGYYREEVNEGERRYIKGLRCYLAKAGKKAYFCYNTSNQ